MTILGIGVDIVQLSRIDRLIRTRSAQRLANRILDGTEMRVFERIMMGCQPHAREREDQSGRKQVELLHDDSGTNRGVLERSMSHSRSNFIPRLFSMNAVRGSFVSGLRPSPTVVDPADSVLEPETHDASQMLDENGHNGNARDEHIIRFLAGRWAAKEAAYKAAYPELCLTWKDVCVEQRDDSPKPELTLPKHDHIRGHLSISHDGDYLVAQVLLETVERT